LLLSKVLVAVETGFQIQHGGLADTRRRALRRRALALLRDDRVVLAGMSRGMCLALPACQRCWIVVCSLKEAANITRFVRFSMAAWHRARRRERAMEGGWRPWAKTALSWRPRREARFPTHTTAIFCVLLQRQLHTASSKAVRCFPFD
jgi:hypothetical protein